MKKGYNSILWIFKPIINLHALELALKKSMRVWQWTSINKVRCMMSKQFHRVWNMMLREKNFHAALLILILANVPVFKTEYCKAFK